VLICRRRRKQYPASRHINTNTIVIVTPMPAAAPVDIPLLALGDDEAVEDVVAVAVLAEEAEVVDMALGDDEAVEDVLAVAVLAEEAEVVDMVAPRIRNWADSAISLLPRWIGWLVS
jgi:hypothetical protein